jgi:hypothetical protein
MAGLSGTVSYPPSPESQSESESSCGTVPSTDHVIRQVGCKMEDFTNDYDGTVAALSAQGELPPRARLFLLFSLISHPSKS